MESEPFLSETERSINDLDSVTDGDEAQTEKQEQESSSKSYGDFMLLIGYYVLLVVNLAIITFCIISLILLGLEVVKAWRFCPRVPYSLPLEYIEYESVTSDMHEKSDLQGPFTPALEKAWDTLLEGEVFRATEEELRRTGAWADDAIRLENGGYMAGVGVMHDLHCLGWLKRNYAKSNMSSLERSNHEIEHLDHCIWVLLKGAQCRPDLSIGAVYWDTNSQYRRRTKPRSQTCVKWDSLMGWLRPRLINVTDGKFEGAISPVGLIRHGSATIEPFEG